MDYYFNEKEYSVWARPYELILNNFINRVDALRLRMDEAFPEMLTNNPELTKKIYATLDLIERKMKDAIPRDFRPGFEPLTRGEAFGEDIKLIFNLIYKYCKQPIPFKGIYQAEKERVEKADEEFDFKKHLIEAIQMVNELLGEEGSEDVTYRGATTMQTSTTQMTIPAPTQPPSQPPTQP